MSKENPQGAFAQASGSMTRVEVAMAWARNDPRMPAQLARELLGIDRDWNCAAITTVSAEILAEEIARLQESSHMRAAIIEECAKAVETQVPGTRYQWLCKSMFGRLVSESALRVRALKSSNDKPSERAAENGGVK